MRVFHATKTLSALEAIKSEQKLKAGKNVADRTALLIHLSLDPFSRGSWALDVIGKDTNEAWIVELEIADDTPLEPDPSWDGEHYNGRWVVVRQNELPVHIVGIIHIPNVQKWEGREENCERRIL